MRETSNTMAVPENPKIYHITHVDNLPSIMQTGHLSSDAKVIANAMPHTTIGMSEIKQRRLNKIGVTCHPGTMVGEYVPFYFCPRSIMLFMMYKGNHPDITYKGGQGPIVHLRADLRTVVAWADADRKKWAFSDRNAGAFYTNFYNDLRMLDRIHWDAVESHDFSLSTILEKKQAEFLLYDSFPWELVEHIGVHNAGIEAQVRKALNGVARPTVRVEPTWYY